MTLHTQPKTALSCFWTTIFPKQNRSNGSSPILQFYSTSEIKTIEPNIPEFVMSHAGRRYLLKGRQIFVKIVYTGVWIHSVGATHVAGLNK